MQKFRNLREQVKLFDTYIDENYKKLENSENIMQWLESVSKCEDDYCDSWEMSKDVNEWYHLQELVLKENSNKCKKEIIRLTKIKIEIEKEIIEL
jgi:uncharacterized membrane protein